MNAAPQPPDEITFEQIIIEGRQDVFTNRVNELLMDGWTVVPGTFDVKSLEQGASETTPRALVTARGTALWSKFFIVLRRTEKKASVGAA